jgi:ribosomal silencing factor RsfS
MNPSRPSYNNIISNYVETIICACDNKKAINITPFHIANMSNIARYMILVEVKNKPHASAVTDEIQVGRY